MNCNQEKTGIYSTLLQAFLAKLINAHLNNVKITGKLRVIKEIDILWLPLSHFMCKNRRPANYQCFEQMHNSYFKQRPKMISI